MELKSASKIFNLTLKLIGTDEDVYMVSIKNLINNPEAINEYLIASKERSSANDYIKIDEKIKAFKGNNIKKMINEEKNRLWICIWYRTMIIINITNENVKEIILNSMLVILLWSLASYAFRWALFRP